MGAGYVVANGIRIFYVEEGTGPLVLLCHGFPEAWYSWRHQMAPVAEAGFRAVAIDLPGYGRSDKPDVAYDVVWLSACVAGIITGLGHQRAVVVGHDWGGLIAWPFARLHPDRTAGVVGVNTPDLPRTPEPPIELLRRLRPERPPYLVQFQARGAAEFFIHSDVDAFIRTMFLGPATKRPEVFTREVLQRYADDFRPMGAIAPPLEYYRNMDRSWHLLAGVADRTIDVPCLMVSAADDIVLTPAMADGMEERVPDLVKAVIDDCGHWTQQERPDELTRHLVGWLARLAPFE